MDNAAQAQEQECLSTTAVAWCFDDERYIGSEMYGARCSYQNDLRHLRYRRAYCAAANTVTMAAISLASPIHRRRLRRRSSA